MFKGEANSEILTHDKRAQDLWKSYAETGKDFWQQELSTSPGPDKDILNHRAQY